MKHKSVLKNKYSEFIKKTKKVFCSVKSITPAKARKFRPLPEIENILEARTGDLKESEDRNRAMLNALPDMMFLFSEDGTFLDYHAPDSQLLKAPPEAFMGHNIKELFPCSISEITMEQIKNIIKTGKNAHYSYELPIGEETRSFESRMVPCGDNNFLAIVHEVTNLKSAEKEKENLQNQLIQAQKMEAVGRLAGGVAHDFNNMLSVIMGHSEMILEQLDDSSPLFSSLNEIKKAAGRSADLTRQLLAFARKQAVAPEIIDLDKAVERMLKMLRRLIGEDIDLIWKPSETHGSIKIDKSQVDQIMANLCINARDAISGTGTISISTENIYFNNNDCLSVPGIRPGNYIILSVSDSGCGMDKETLSNIFEPFFTTKEREKGTGLGLATVYGIIKQNNGFINVKSTPGEGSEFRIYLPEYEKKIKEKQKENCCSSEINRATILLVEDETEILEITRMMLEYTGYKVLPPNTPEEAIITATGYQEKIDILLTDVIMPEMNGRELKENIEKLYPGLKCLFMSGYTSDIIAPHGIMDKNVNFIQKPFSMRDLNEKIGSII